MRYLSALFVAMLMLSGFGVLVIANDVTETPLSAKHEASAIVNAGEYRDLNFWRKLKLGTAPYVNPRLLRRAVVAYVYDIDKVMEKWGRKTVVDMVEAGLLAVAVRVQTNYSVSKPEQGNWLSMISLPEEEDGSTQEVREDLVFVSRSLLLDIPPEGAVVSWHAVEPLGKGYSTSSVKKRF